MERVRKLGTSYTVMYIRNVKHKGTEEQVPLTTARVIGFPVYLRYQMLLA
jgi:hypothetical protein